jgi:hypothetical protein
MDPALLASTVVSLLMPYLKKGATEFVELVGQTGYEKVKGLLATLRKRWSSDPEAAGQLARLERKPDTYRAPVEDMLTETLTRDPSFAKQIDQTVKDLGPIIEVPEDAGGTWCDRRGGERVRRGTAK